MIKLLKKLLKLWFEPINHKAAFYITSHMTAIDKLLNQIKYPRRFAQALNKQGVPVLKTESSFASNPQVLIDQLKFIIDSNPNLTAE